MNEFSMRRHWGPSPKYPLVIDYKPPKNEFIVISGPCSVEGSDQIIALARDLSNRGVSHLRGGVFRAGTFPGQSFGWIEENLISEFHKAAVDNGLKNIIEVLDYRDLDMVLKYASCLQVGCRQMQNYTLLKEVGSSGLPVFLKRNPGATIDELLGSAEWILKAGCKELYLIERGSSTNATHVRWDLSLSLIPAIKSISNIPVIVDASHGTGRRDLVGPMTLAGVAAGAGGILVETHYSPKDSLSDADQALPLHEFETLLIKVNKIREII